MPATEILLRVASQVVQALGSEQEMQYGRVSAHYLQVKSVVLTHWVSAAHLQAPLFSTRLPWHVLQAVAESQVLHSAGQAVQTLLALS